MMEENGSKKVLLSVLGVAILVVAVVGISFAAFSAIDTSDANTISTGTISMSYNEPTNGISITDALPMDETTAVATYTESGEMFQFTVSTNASGALNVPYEINITPVTASNALADTQVMVNLFKGDEKVVAGTLISGLTESTLRTDSKFVYTATDEHAGNDAATTTYTLRMWIPETINYDDVTGKEYHLKVNVDAAIAPRS